jgi:hypothetical protein
MLDDEHLHIDEKDALVEWLVKALHSAKAGAIEIDFESEPAVKIRADNGDIAVNLLEPTIFKIPEDETGLFDKLKTASEFGRKLSENGVTLSFLRRDKEAIRLGKNANPTLSKLITRSDDIQMSSVSELTKLKRDLKAD